MTFIVYALPRSRTAWLSKFLSYGDWHCGHEEIRHARSLDDVKSWFKQPLTGTVETAAAPWWRLVKEYAPDARIVVVRRPVSEVMDSLNRLNLPFEQGALYKLITRLDQKLDQIEERVECISIPYDSLHDEDVCASVFEWCLPYKHNSAWWEANAGRNYQIDMRAMCRYFAAYAPQHAKLTAQAKSHLLAKLDRPLREPDELTFKEELLDPFLAAAEPLMREHCSAAGEHPDNWRNKNWDAVRSLEQLGAHQIVTARCNGRIFGYLFTAIGPSLEDPTIRVGCPTYFCASPEFKGLGRQLIRASRDLLKAKGVDEIIFRAGVRGDGPRLGPVYERMGAEPFGQLYRLQLKEG